MTQEREPDGSTAGDRGALPAWRDLTAALALLTVLPLRRPEPKSEPFARATVFFPLIGLLIGAVLAGVNWAIAGRWPPWLAGLVLVGAWEVLGRGDTVRAMAGAGRAGMPAAGASLLAKAAALGAAAGARPAALLFAPMLARWCMVVLATGARDAQAAGQKFNSAVTFREFALTSVFTCTAVFTVAEAFGILVVVCVAALTLGLRLLLHRRPGGVSWPLLLASAQLIETVVVVLFAVL